MLWLALLCTVSISTADDFIPVTSCDEMEAPEFGNVTFHTGANGEQKATFNCTVGYVLTGDSTLTCVGDHWNGSTPACKLDIFDKNSVTCNLNSSTGCTYVNDVRNPILWQVEEVDEEDDGTVKVIQKDTPATLLRCEPEFCPRQSPLLRRRRSRPEKQTIFRLPHHHLSRRDTVKPLATKVVLDIKKFRRRRSTITLTELDTFFEIGKFSVSLQNSFLKFSVQGLQGALFQIMYVAAHCLPDPPGHLDQLHSDGITPVSMTLTSTGSSETKCVQLKDRVQHCKEFTVRFSLYIRHYATQTGQIAMQAKGTHKSLTDALCQEKDLLNP